MVGRRRTVLAAWLFLATLVAFALGLEAWLWLDRRAEERERARAADAIGREAERLGRENDALGRENDALERENDALERENDALERENDRLESEPGPR